MVVTTNNQRQPRCLGQGYTQNEAIRHESKQRFRATGNQRHQIVHKLLKLLGGNLVNPLIRPDKITIGTYLVLATTCNPICNYTLLGM